MQSLPVSHPTQKLSDTPKAYNKYNVSIIKVQSETNTPASVVAKGSEEAGLNFYNTYIIFVISVQVWW